jgi:hypothetical protein
MHSANRRGAQLQGADLLAAQLQGANLTLAHLEAANLTGAQLEGSDLSGAELQGASLVGSISASQRLIFRPQASSSLPPSLTALVKGFGCRPVVTCRRAEGRRPKAPRKEPGAGRAASSLWGFKRGGGLRRGCAGRGNRQRIGDRSGEFGTAAAVEEAILA